MNTSEKTQEVDTFIPNTVTMSKLINRPQSKNDCCTNETMDSSNQFSIHEYKEVNAKPRPFSRRDFYKITIQFGASRLEYADKAIIIDSPSLIFTSPLIPYSWEPISEEQNGFFVLFTEEFLRETNGDLTLEHFPLFKLGSNPVYNLSSDQVAYIMQIFQNMFKEYHSDYAHKFNLLRNHLNVLMHEALKLQPKVDYTAHVNASSRIASLFMDLLDRQFPVDPWHPLKLKTPKDMAAQLSIHVNHLNFAVKEATGKTTTILLNERIILEARALIINSDWNISEISSSLGYEYPTYFNNLFKKTTGESPTSLRASKLV